MTLTLKEYVAAVVLLALVALPAQANPYRLITDTNTAVRDSPIIWFGAIRAPAGALRISTVTHPSLMFPFNQR
jgi:hypothetical protein